MNVTIIRGLQLVEFFMNTMVLGLLISSALV